MKKSFIFILLFSLLVTSCRWLKEITEVDSESVLQQNVEGKTSCKPFSELNSPIVFTQSVYDEYDINCVGSVVVVFDCEKKEVFDWMYVENPGVVSNSVAIPLQKSPDSPITYALNSSSYYKSYFLETDGTLRTYDKFVDGSKTWRSKYSQKPRYLLVTDIIYNSGDEGYRSGITLNTIDCVDGSASETIGLEHYSYINDATPDQNGVYWFTAPLGPLNQLFYFDSTNNQIVETPFYHSIYPDDLLQKELEKILSPVEEEDDDDDEDYDYPGTDSLKVQYLTDSKIYIYNYRDIVDEANSTEEYYAYETKDYILVVDRNDYSVKEYSIDKFLHEKSVSFIDLFENEGKLWVLASGFYADYSMGVHVYEFVEGNDEENCLIENDDKKLWINSDNIYCSEYQVCGKNIYFFDSSIYSGITIYWMNLETGEWDCKVIQNSEFNCPK